MRLQMFVALDQTNEDKKANKSQQNTTVSSTYDRSRWI